jgi:hypothetical protein
MNNELDIALDEETFEPETPESIFADLGPYLDGVAEPIVPTVAQIWPGRCLFYAGAVNEIHGEPSVGKTNILLAAAGCVLEAGGCVLFIDPEDHPQRIVARLLALGIDREAIRARFYYLHDPDDVAIAKAQQWADIHAPALVILDGLAESLAREGKNESDPADVLTFFRERMRPFSNAGAAVVVADHVVKNNEGRGRWARGSGAKLGHYNGVSYEITLGESYTPTKAGFARLKVSKDRNGGVGPMGATVAELHFAPNPQGGTITLWKSPPEPGDFKPSHLMEKVKEHLRLYGETNKTELLKVGNHQWADEAIKQLLKDGTITMRTEGQRKIFSLADAKE